MSSAVAQSKPFIRPTTTWDIAELALTMREEDKQELSFTASGSPLAALTLGLEHSNELCTIVKDGKVAAIFGVVGQKGVAGVPWMLGADGLIHCKSLLRECRKIVTRYTEEYRYLTNACWSQNTVHVEWIKWLGFKFEGSDIRKGETFLHFHKEHHV